MMLLNIRKSEKSIMHALNTTSASPPTLMLLRSVNGCPLLSVRGFGGKGCSGTWMETSTILTAIFAVHVALGLNGLPPSRAVTVMSKLRDTGPGASSGKNSRMKTFEASAPISYPTRVTRRNQSGSPWIDISTFAEIGERLRTTNCAELSGL